MRVVVFDRVVLSYWVLGIGVVLIHTFIHTCAYIYSVGVVYIYLMYIFRSFT